MNLFCSDNDIESKLQKNDTNIKNLNLSYNNLTKRPDIIGNLINL